MKRPTFSLTLWTVLLSSLPLPALAAPPAPEYASFSPKLPCVFRIGRCFDATIAGQPVVVVADKKRSEQLTHDAQQKNRRVRDIYWEVLTPVDGQRVFELEVKPNALGLPVVGELQTDPEITIFPLQEQALESETTLKARDDVRINGQATVTQQETLTQDFLPPGEYVLSIRYRGTGNWDRKTVFVIVK